SSRVPLVRDTVRAAFCNPALPEHVRSLEPLLHEPDLCVAYGAALRAATHGTRYVFSLAPFAGQGGSSERQGDRETRRPGDEEATSLELYLTSPASTRDTNYHATGIVSLSPCLRVSLSPCLELTGGSVRIRSLATGLIEEAFLDDKGTFAHDIELE